jgi:integrase
MTGNRSRQPEKGEKVRYATAYALRHTHITRMLLKFGASKKETIARLQDGMTGLVLIQK